MSYFSFQAAECLNMLQSALTVIANDKFSYCKLPRGLGAELFMHGNWDWAQLVKKMNFNFTNNDLTPPIGPLGTYFYTNHT